MANYYMQGGDGKEYGPTSTAQLRQWVAEGRANAQTVVRDSAGGPYVALGTVPELNGSAGTAQTPIQTAPMPAFTQSRAPSEYFMRGGDGKEYGPVSALQLRQWVAEGRANTQTMVRDTAGGPYLALGMVPELNGQTSGRPMMTNLPLAYTLAQNAAMGGADEGAQVKRLASIVAAGSAWMRTLAVIMFLLAALLGCTIIGLVIAWLPIWQGIVMWGAATKAQQAVYTGSEQDLQQALEKVRKTYLLGVILVIALVIFKIVVNTMTLMASGVLDQLGGGLGGLH